MSGGKRAPGRTPSSPALALPRLGPSPSTAAIAATYNQAATQIEGADRANLKRMQDAPVAALVMVSQPNGRAWLVWLDDSDNGTEPVMRFTGVQGG